MIPHIDNKSFRALFAQFAVPCLGVEMYVVGSGAYFMGIELLTGGNELSRKRV